MVLVSGQADAVEGSVKGRISDPEPSKLVDGSDVAPSVDMEILVADACGVPRP